MAIYTNGPVVGPDGCFVDRGSKIPDTWVENSQEWVANRLERGDFVEQDELAPEPPGSTSAVPMDGSVVLGSARGAEATQ